MKCPLCNTENLYVKKVRNSLSRVDNETYICNKCGLKEALYLRKPGLPGVPRVCLLVQPELSNEIMLVTEDEGGYLPFGKPASEEFASSYVDTTNEKLGLTREDVDKIVISSMAMG